MECGRTDRYQRCSEVPRREAPIKAAVLSVAATTKHLCAVYLKEKRGGEEGTFHKVLGLNSKVMGRSCSIDLPLQ